MASRGRSWTQKLEAEAQPVVKPAPIKIAGMKAGEVMLVPTPRMIDAFIREIPRGCAVPVMEMRKTLAARSGAEVCCPIYTGYHLRTVAEAACEKLDAGAPPEAVTPFWRVIGPQTPTAGRIACGVAFIRARRADEGIEG